MQADGREGLHCFFNPQRTCAVRVTVVVLCVCVCVCVCLYVRTIFQPYAQSQVKPKIPSC